MQIDRPQEVEECIPRRKISAMHNEDFPSVCWWCKFNVRMVNSFYVAAGRQGNEFLSNFHLGPDIFKACYLMFTIENPYLLEVIHCYRFTFDDNWLSFAVGRKKALLKKFIVEVNLEFLA